MKAFTILYFIILVKLHFYKRKSFEYEKSFENLPF